MYRVIVPGDVAVITLRTPDAPLVTNKIYSQRCKTYTLFL
jgi:hypothetical protein